MSAKNNIVSFATRWRPDFRYSDSKHYEATMNLFESTTPSVTDKEAYRVTLASLRGEIAQGSGNPKVGSYSLKEGEEYNPRYDFSFLNRKDITIVDIDEHIKVMQRQLEEADSELKSKIEKELASAQKKKETLEKEQSDKNDKIE